VIFLFVVCPWIAGATFGVPYAFYATIYTTSASTINETDYESDNDIIVEAEAPI